MNKTENLNLNKYDPILDAKEPFSISDGLNANWDIIDSELVKKSGDTMTNTLKFDTSELKSIVINTDKVIGQANENLSDIEFRLDNIGIGMLRAVKSTSGTKSLQLIVKDSSGNNVTQLTVGSNVDGTSFYTTAPACSGTNSIVTTLGLSKSSNGYVKFGNGVILQWGDYSVTSGSSVQITLPTAFSSVNSYKFVCTDGGSARVAMGFTRNSSTKVTLWAAGSGNGGCWLAMGY